MDFFIFLKNLIISSYLSTYHQILDAVFLEDCCGVKQRTEVPRLRQRWVLVGDFSPGSGLPETNSAST